MPRISTIDVVLLCGGRGKRLKPSVNNRPKPMAEINNRPFLDILIDYISGFGFRRFILSTGYMANFIKEYYQKKESPLEFIFSEEERPLGTGGAIKNAEALIKSPVFLVLNGDSFCDVNLQKFLNFHLDKKALVTMALTVHDDCKEYGTVILGDLGLITGFYEKNGKYQDGLINTGIYLFEKKALALMPEKKSFSLEKDFFSSINKGLFYGYKTDRPLLDIGTPERYDKAKEFFKKEIY